MKIAFVYDAVYPWIQGGAERRIYEIAKRLAPHHEIHIFGIKWWKGPDILKQNNITYHGVCAPRELYTNGRRSISEAIIFALAIIKPLLKEHFDVIDVSSFPYLPIFTTKLTAIINQTPLVVTWHEVWGNYWYEYLGHIGVLGKIIEQASIHIPSHRIAVSQHTASKLPRSKVIPNGIDLNLIDSIPPTDTTSNHSEGFDVIFTGRLIKEKRVDLLIKSLKHTTNTSCGIIGEGPECETLKKLALETGVAHRIKFLGFLPYARVLSIMKSSKIFAFPSHREGFGMAALEAMACELPVITVNTPNNASTELIQHNNGYIVKPDEHNISNKLKTLLTNETQRKNMAKNARTFAEKYTWDNITKEIEKIYKKTTNKQKKHPHTQQK